MAFLPAVLAVASAVTGTIGAISEGQTQGQTARLNYMTAQRNAVSASDAGQQKGLRSDQEFAQLRGQQEATQAASGLDILGRTQAMTRLSTDNTRAKTAGDIRSQTDAQVAGFRSDMLQAKIDADAAKRGAIIGSVKSLVGGASSLTKKKD